MNHAVALPVRGYSLRVVETGIEVRLEVEGDELFFQLDPRQALDLCEAVQAATREWLNSRRSGF